MGISTEFTDPKASRREAKRSLRRAHKERMGRKAIKAYPWMSPDRAMRLADHIKHCSCYMCGNPRRVFGSLPVSEVRQNMKDSYRDEDN